MSAKRKCLRCGWVVQHGHQDAHLAVSHQMTYELAHGKTARPRVVRKWELEQFAPVEPGRPKR